MAVINSKPNTGSDDYFIHIVRKYTSIFILSLMAFSLNAQELTSLVYQGSEVILKTPTGNLSGTLSVPNDTAKTPLVIIIAGSGPTDRDCNSILGIQTYAYKMLAENLVKSNISTFRFDKRGIAKSQGAMTKESDLRFETYIDDVIALINQFSKDKRFSEIILLGHSEGSLIGIIAAEKSSVSAFISVSGVGRSADKILQLQLKDQLPFNLLIESNKIIDSLKAGKTVSVVSQQLQAIYRQSIQPYMISWFKYDPSVEIQKLKIPVLILQGNTDLQVPIEDAKMLSTAKPDAKLVVFDNMNHVLKESDANLKNNKATYNNPDLPLKTGLTDTIVSFIKNIK